MTKQYEGIYSKQGRQSRLVIQVCIIITVDTQYQSVP